MKSPKSGSSHCVFRKDGCNPITIPRHVPIKTVYVKMVRDIVEQKMGKVWEDGGELRLRTLEEYMNIPYELEIVQDKDESGFVASYPELPGCITCGQTVLEARHNAEEAKKEWLLQAIEDNIEIAEPESALS